MTSCATDRKAESLRTQCFGRRTSSALSASPRFKTSPTGQHISNTQIPACTWSLTKTKQKRGPGSSAFRMRTGEVLFIDARKLGYMVDRFLRAFTDEDTEKIVSTFHAWKRGPSITENVSGKALAAGSSNKISRFVRGGNAETLRTQSCCPRIFSALSASPRFKISPTGQLFANTQIPACIWFLTKTKQKRGRGAAAFRDRTGEVLFIDARKLGYMVDRVLRAFTDEDTAQIVSTFHAWKRDKDVYEDIPGFCKSATLDEVAEHGYVLTPGRYVGAEEVEDDGVPFAERMEGLTRELATQFRESEKLQAAIRSPESACFDNTFQVSSRFFKSKFTNLTDQKASFPRRIIKNITLGSTIGMFMRQAA